MSTTTVFYDGGTSVVDLVTPSGLGMFSKATKEQLEQQYGPLQIIALDEAVKLMEQAACKDPVEIDRAAFDEALCVLPPLKWENDGGIESFRLGEPFSGTVHISYVRIGSRYFEMKRPLRDSHEELVGAVTIMLSTKSRKR